MHTRIMFTLQQGMITPAPTPIDVDEPTERVVAITPSVKPSATAIRTPEIVAARDAPPVPTAKSTERPTDTPTAQTPVSATTDIPTPTAMPATTSTPTGTHTPIASILLPHQYSRRHPRLCLYPLQLRNPRQLLLLNSRQQLLQRQKRGNSHCWEHRLSTWSMHGGTETTRTRCETSKVRSMK